MAVCTSRRLREKERQERGRREGREVETIGGLIRLPEHHFYARPAYPVPLFCTIPVTGLEGLLEVCRAGEHAGPVGHQPLCG